MINFFTSDLAHALGSKVKQPLQQPFVKNLIADCLSSESPQSQDVAKWAKDVLFLHLYYTNHYI